MTLSLQAPAGRGRYMGEQPPRRPLSPRGRHSLFLPSPTITSKQPQVCRCARLSPPASLALSAASLGSAGTPRALATRTDPWRASSGPRPAHPPAAAPSRRRLEAAPPYLPLAAPWCAWASGSCALCVATPTNPSRGSSPHAAPAPAGRAHHECGVWQAA